MGIVPQKGPQAVAVPPRVHMPPLVSPLVKGRKRRRTVTAPYDETLL